MHPEKYGCIACFLNYRKIFFFPFLFSALSMISGALFSLSKPTGNLLPSDDQ
jgi:hypothetical protein